MSQEDCGKLVDATQLLQDIREGTLQGREALEKLAATKQFVFHGSKQKLNALEPRQAYSDNAPDGAPAVFAAGEHAVALAVFMALRGPGKSGFSTQSAHDGFFDLRADQAVIDHMRSQNAVGYVHVLSKHEFTRDTHHQWRSPEVVRPIIVVPVTARDLPEAIATLH